MNPQTIVSLRAENTKRLVAVEINPDGAPVVVLGGRNGQGKSSVLDALSWVFQGKGAMPDMPIRQGTNKAVILAQTQDYIVERRITPGGNTVTVKAADGSRITSPQQVLDSLYSDIAFDPLSFIRGKVKDQVAMLQTLTGFDATTWEARRLEAYNRRTEVNRTVKELEVTAPTIHHGITKLIDTQEVLASLRVKKAEIDSHDKKKAQIARCKERVQELHKQLRLALEEEDALEEAFSKLNDPSAEIKTLEESFVTANENNNKFKENMAAAQHEQRLAKAREEAAGLTATLANLDGVRARALAETALPVPGLTFTGDEVLLNGVPLKQASSAEQLRVSVAVAFAQSPGLRVAIIRDGSLLDDDSLALVAKLVGEAGGQVWIERVGTGEEVSVVIEDGAIIEDRMTGKKPKAAKAKEESPEEAPQASASVAPAVDPLDAF